MVQIKRKVTIKKKTEQVEEPSGEKPVVTPDTPNTPTEPTPTPTPEPSNKGKWIGAAVAALLIAGGAYYYSTNSSEIKQTPTQEEVVNEGQQEEGANATDSTASEQNQEKQGAEQVNEATVGTSDAPAENNEQQKQEVKEQPAPKKEVVNEVATTADVSSSTEENAKRVIRGEFGNGQTRKDKLGDKYAEIQSRVNEMYRNGLVK